MICVKDYDNSYFQSNLKPRNCLHKWHSHDKQVWFRLREVLNVTYWVGQSNESKHSEEKESDRSIEVAAKRWRLRAISQLSITRLHFYLAPPPIDTLAHNKYKTEILNITKNKQSVTTWLHFYLVCNSEKQ